MKLPQSRKCSKHASMGGFYAGSELGGGDRAGFRFYERGLGRCPAAADRRADRRLGPVRRFRRPRLAARGADGGRRFRRRGLGRKIEILHRRHAQQARRRGRRGAALVRRRGRRRRSPICPSRRSPSRCRRSPRRRTSTVHDHGRRRPPTSPTNIARSIRRTGPTTRTRWRRLAKAIVESRRQDLVLPRPRHRLRRRACRRP